MSFSAFSKAENALFPHRNLGVKEVKSKNYDGSKSCLVCFFVSPVTYSSQTNWKFRILTSWEEVIFWFFADWNCVFSMSKSLWTGDKGCVFDGSNSCLVWFLMWPVICSPQTNSKFRIQTPWGIVIFYVLAGWKCVFFSHRNLFEQMVKWWNFNGSKWCLVWFFTWPVKCTLYRTSKYRILTTIEVVIFCVFVGLIFFPTSKYFVNKR